VAQNGLGNAPEDGPLKSCPAAGRHDDHPGLDRPSCGEDLVLRVTHSRDGLHVHALPGRRGNKRSEPPLQSGADRLQLLIHVPAIGHFLFDLSEGDHMEEHERPAGPAGEVGRIGHAGE